MTTSQTLAQSGVLAALGGDRAGEAGRRVGERQDARGALQDDDAVVIRVAFGDDHGQPGVRLDVADADRALDRGEPDLAVVPDEGDRRGVRTPVGAGGGDHRVPAAPQDQDEHLRHAGVGWSLV